MPKPAYNAKHRISTTRNDRIFAMWRSERKSYDYRTGYGPRPLLAVAHRFKMPIVQVRGIIEEMRQRRREEQE